MELLVATTNPGKFKEVSAFLKDLPLQIVSLTDLLDPPRVIEDGLTFEENAVKKARALAEFSGLLTLADDSGLEVDALNGGPGIYSARYASDACDDIKNNQTTAQRVASGAQTEEHRPVRLRAELCVRQVKENAGLDRAGGL